MELKSKNIVRYAGDTYPTKIYIKVNGVPIDLHKWNVDLRYKTADGRKMVVSCDQLKATEGLVGIYPHAREYASNTDLYDENKRVPFSKHESTESQAAETEDDSIAPNQVWDEGEGGNEYPYAVVRWRRYEDGYIEEMTHASGKIILVKRL